MHAGIHQEWHVEKIASFLEAAYELASDDDAWLISVMNAARDVIEHGGAMHGGTYDASHQGHRFHQLRAEGCAQEGEELARHSQIHLTPSLVRILRCNRVLVSGQKIPELAALYESMMPTAPGDTLLLSGCDPCGKGIFVGLQFKEPRGTSRDEFAVYARMAQHLSAAHRCRRRLREAGAERGRIDPTEGAEAIIDSRERIVHASGPATSPDARRQLLEAAKARRQSRSLNGDVYEGLRRFRALTAARWSLIEQLDPSGERLTVARENRPEIPGLAHLSERERQVVAYASLGQSAQETAYTLGISSATVRMLLGRAGQKLGVTNREQLMAHPEVQALST